MIEITIIIMLPHGKRTKQFVFIKIQDQLKKKSNHESQLKIRFHSVFCFSLLFSLCKYELITLPLEKDFIVIIPGSNSYL